MGAELIEIDRAENAQNQGEQTAQQERRSQRTARRRCFVFRLVQSSKCPSRRRLETITYVVKRGDPLTDSDVFFSVDEMLENNVMLHFPYAEPTA
jgi:hypothetical protein